MNEIPRYPEQDVIKPLLTVPAFAAFYRAERARIPWPVYWTVDLTLPPGIAALHTHYWAKPGSDDTDYALIRLPSIPPDNPLAVAHELSHSILDAEGYPCTGYFSRPSIKWQCASLGAAKVLFRVKSSQQEYASSVSTIRQVDTVLNVKGLKAAKGDVAHKPDQKVFVW